MLCCVILSIYLSKIIETLNALAVLLSYCYSVCSNVCLPFYFQFVESDADEELLFNIP